MPLKGSGQPQAAAFSKGEPFFWSSRAVSWLCGAHVILPREKSRRFGFPFRFVVSSLPRCRNPYVVSAKENFHRISPTSSSLKMKMFPHFGKSAIAWTIGFLDCVLVRRRGSRCGGLVVVFRQFPPNSSPNPLRLHNPHDAGGTLSRLEVGGLYLVPGGVCPVLYLVPGGVFPTRSPC